MFFPAEIQAEREGVVLRQLTEADDLAYYEAYAASRPEIEAFDPTEDRGKYQTLDEVRQARLLAPAKNRLRFGVWDDRSFVGSINLTPDPNDPTTAEIGYWADSRYTGLGYTTLATRALATFGTSRYQHLVANVVEGNQASVRVLEKSGFRQSAAHAGKLAFSLANTEFERPLRSRGAGIIFYIEPTDEMMFFLRDDKPTISCPGMIDIIGGHMEKGEDPKEAALREVGEELTEVRTGKPPVLDPEKVEHFKTFIDGRPGEHNIFTYRLKSVPNLRTNEGQGLVLLNRDEARQTEFAYGYSAVVNELLDKLPS